MAIKRFNKQITREGRMPMTIDQCYRDNYSIVYGYLLSLCGNPSG